MGNDVYWYVGSSLFCGAGFGFLIGWRKSYFLLISAVVWVVISTGMTLTRIDQSVYNKGNQELIATLVYMVAPSAIVGLAIGWSLGRLWARRRPPSVRSMAEQQAENREAMEHVAKLARASQSAARRNSS